MLLNRSTRLSLSSLALAATFGLMACEPMAPSGDPLAAVAVKAPGSDDGAAPVKDPRFPDTDPVELSSKDLTASSKSKKDGAGATPKLGSPAAPASVDDADTSTDAVASTEPAPEAATPAVESKPAPRPAAAPASAAPSGTMGWPVRLVRTHLDEQPPSAVLAMPDGRRIVVSPGDMVPERGLVVMAIGRERVQLAAVNSNGDHATVVPMELTSQY